MSLPCHIPFGVYVTYANGSGGAGGSPAESLSSVTYAYDHLGRLSGVVADIGGAPRVFVYTRAPGTDLVTGYMTDGYSRWVCEGTGTQRQILIKPDDENDSNIRWWYLGSNKNMLYAYGGARITISGTAIFDNTGSWSGEFDVEIKDKYEWVKADGFADIVKEYLSRLYSQTYDAAVYLQQNCGKKVFSHVANFDVTCTGCCQQVGSQR